MIFPYPKSWDLIEKALYHSMTFTQECSIQQKVFPLCDYSTPV